MVLEPAGLAEAQDAGPRRGLPAPHFDLTPHFDPTPHFDLTPRRCTPLLAIRLIRAACPPPPGW